MKALIKKSLFVFCLLMLITVLFGCENAEKSFTESKLQVVATLFPQYDFTRQIAGDKVEITLLLPPGVDCHSYDPTPADIIEIKESDLFIYTEESMEPWAARLISGNEIKGEVISVVEGLSLTEDEHDGHSHDVDPHVWTNPVNAIAIVQSISKALCSADSANSDFYRQNASEYIERLRDIDRRFEEAVKEARLKKMIFGGKFALHYFEERYGLSHLAAFDSCNSETEPAARVVADIIREIQKNQIKVVFHEELSDAKTAQVIAAETGAGLLLFHSCHNLSSEEFRKGETYLSLMEKNLINLKEGLS